MKNINHQMDFKFLIDLKEKTEFLMVYIKLCYYLLLLLQPCICTLSWYSHFRGNGFTVIEIEASDQFVPLAQHMSTQQDSSYTHTPQAYMYM